MSDTSKIPLSDLKLLVKEVIRESLTDRTKSDYVGLPLKPIGKVPEKGKGELKGSGLLKALKPKDDKKMNEAGLTSEGTYLHDLLAKVPEKDLNFIEDLMKKHHLSLPEAIRDYLEMYGPNQSGKPVSMSPRPGEMFEGNKKWIQKAVDPEHKGYCTPMTKPTCTPARKALAKRFKKGIDEGAGESDPMSVLSQITSNIGDDAAIAKLNPEVAKKKLTVIRSILNSLVAKSQQGQQSPKQVAEGGPQYKQVSPNETDTAKEDKAREIQCDPKVNEASYKVVAPKAATDAKEDKARTIQTEPKVNETAYKTQGPSYKTFDDSPQLPDAVNDPENA